MKTKEFPLEWAIKYLEREKESMPKFKKIFEEAKAKFFPDSVQLSLFDE